MLILAYLILSQGLFRILDSIFSVPVFLFPKTQSLIFVVLPANIIFENFELFGYFRGLIFW